MLQPHLISAILNEPWAINEDAIQGLVPLISNIFNPAIEFEEGKPTLPETLSIDIPVAAVKGVAAGPGSTVSKNVRVISIGGTLLKNDQYCGPAGMATMARWIEEADKDKSVDAILLKIDSPGGTVSGTETLAATIKSVSKPIVAFVDDMACSAAYWIASSCNEVIANNTTAQVGSIGVLLSFMDVQPALELQGVKFHTVTAPQSLNKTRRFDLLRSGNYDDYKENVLRPLADKFIGAVKESRGKIDEKYFSAEVYFAKDVVGSLIDSIGSFNQAVQRSAELAHASVNSQSQLNMSKPNLMRLAKAAGVEAFESSDNTITLTVEMAGAVEQALTDHETAHADLQQQVDQSTNQQTRIEELEGELQTANDRIAELEKGAGAPSAQVHKETDASSEEDSANENFWSRLTRLSQSLKK